MKSLVQVDVNLNPDSRTAEIGQFQSLAIFNFHEHPVAKDRQLWVAVSSWSA